MSRSRPAGDAALLIDTEAPARLAAAVAAAQLAGVVDVLPGARTVLVITEPGTWHLEDLARVIEALPLPEADVSDGVIIEIPVVYDGQDLADVAELSGIPVTEVIARHSGAEYTVGWLGFAPGFGYLTGLDPELRGVPRLASPRLRVPAGSVAIAGGMAAVYPAASPGGWRLLGRTSARLWDPGREPPSLLLPGRRVRFRAVAAGQPADDARQPDVSQPSSGSDHARRRARTIRTAGASTDASASTGTASTGTASTSSGEGAPSQLEVLRPGLLATVQDLGRRGLGGLGVPPSGAADPAGLRLANLLTGNPAGAAVIELTLGRADFRCAGGARMAVTGAPARVTVTAEPGEPATDVAFGTVFDLADGDVISIGAPGSGLRTYLAVAGGIDVPTVLGSRSSDLHSGLGGGPLRPGAMLPIGPRPADQPPTITRRSGSRQTSVEGARRPPITGAAWPAAGHSARVDAETACLRLVPGPRLDWFSADALAILCDAPYSVTAASNRTGLRLDGPALPRSADRELESEGMVTGALQVPHDGKPILLLADHPTVGGYPVIAVVASADICLAAQLRPGRQVWFTIGC